MADLLPEDEIERLVALRDLDLVDTPAEARFDRITRLAQRVFQAPFAMVALMEKERQWFKSAMGHLIFETPRAESFCQYTIAQDSPLIVCDASADSRYFDLPAVFDMGVRFYAGIPVRSIDGKAVGTLCVLDLTKRDSATGFIEPLEDLARWVQAELQLEGLLKSERRMLTEMDQLRRRASLDPVTRCWTHEAGLALLEGMMKDGQDKPGTGLGIILISVEQLGFVNENLGEEAGNMYLRLVADRIRQFSPKETSLSRGRTSTFLLLWPQMPAERSRSAMEYLLHRVSEQNVQLNPQVELKISMCLGMTVFSGASNSADLLLNKATKALGQAKKSGAGSFRQAF
jgi:diguanylate cyclase (GGDEF)-like protein